MEFEGKFRKDNRWICFIWQKKLDMFHLIEVEIYCRHLTMDGYVCLLSKKEAATRRQQLWLIWQKAVTEQTHWKRQRQIQRQRQRKWQWQWQWPLQLWLIWQKAVTEQTMHELRRPFTLGCGAHSRGLCYIAINIVVILCVVIKIHTGLWGTLLLLWFSMMISRSWWPKLEVSGPQNVSWVNDSLPEDKNWSAEEEKTENLI